MSLDPWCLVCILESYFDVLIAYQSWGLCVLSWVNLISISCIQPFWMWLVWLNFTVVAVSFHSLHFPFELSIQQDQHISQPKLQAADKSLKQRQLIHLFSVLFWLDSMVQLGCLHRFHDFYFTDSFTVDSIVKLLMD